MPTQSVANSFDIKGRLMAKGSDRKCSYGKISVTLGLDLFARVNAIAEREGRSFAAVVRDLLAKQLDQQQ